MQTSSRNVNYKLLKDTKAALMKIPTQSEIVTKMRTMLFINIDLVIDNPTYLTPVYGKVLSNSLETFYNVSTLSAEDTLQINLARTYINALRIGDDY